MSDDRGDFFASGGEGSSTGDDRGDFFISGDVAAPKKSEGYQTPDELLHRETARQVVGMGASIAGGVREMYDLIRGKSISEANRRHKEFVSNSLKALGLEPKSELEQQVSSATQAGMASPFNPLNWPTEITDEMARGPLRNPEDDPSAWGYNPDSWSGRFASRQDAERAWLNSGGKFGVMPTTGSSVVPVSAAPIVSGGLQFAAGVAPIAGSIRRPPRPAPSPDMPPSATMEAPAELQLAPSEARQTAPAVAGEAPASELELAPSEPRKLGTPAARETIPNERLTASGAPRSAPFEPQDVPGKPGVKIDTEPVEGGLPKTAAGPRAEILKRVGLQNARDSALSGDAKSAATDFQLSRFDEPAGMQAKAQFEAERAALQNHAESIVKKTGGTLGLDEDTLHIRGQTIARPFDSLREWFDQQTKRLYGEAEQRASGAPVTNLEGVESLLKSPKFRNSLLAKDQGSLLSAVENQLDEFRKGNPQGFTVPASEEVRQWLNQIWTNDNRQAIGQLKDSLDNDVLKGAGEDIYKPARAIVQQRKATLDNPKGIASLMDSDPQTPLNRVTPHVKVADTIMRLDPAQFENVVKTLKEMPEELQPQAQQALSEIRAQFANKLLDAGSSTAVQWNAPAVAKVLKANQAKLRILFADDPAALQSISDLDSAGKILRVDTSYPGAAAQASNALKRGMMSHAIQKMSGTVGGATGAAIGSVVGAPTVGAAIGAAAGERLGGKAAGSMAERAAVNQWRNKITKLSDAPK